MLGVEGDTFRQPDLARTLREIAQGGADAFYRGRIAELIARDMQAHGGLLSADDLANYRVRVSEGGLSGRYRGFDIIGGLDNTGYPTVMQALGILEGFDLARIGAGSVDELHLVAEAQRLAFVDRLAHLGDADSAELPLRGLLSASYAEARRKQIDPTQARPQAQAGDPWAHQGGRVAAPRTPGQGGEGQTTHLTVIDRDRNMVSLLSTLGQHFGSAVIPRDTGVVLNNGTMWFDPVPGRVNSLAPGRRIMTAGVPIIVTRDGRPVLAVGAPGGRRVISSVLHSLVNMLDHGMGPQQAVNTPRVHSEGPTTVVDVRVGPQTMQALRARGHQVEEREETFSTSYFGRPNAVMVQPGTGRLLGGVNQYKPTLALGL
jgi:gamma-glutamyltranspeptidase/glutathione hydrolase